MDLLTIKQAAEFLNISPNTLAYLRHTGDAPPAIKIGRVLRFKQTDLEAWVNAKYEAQKN